MRWCKLLSISEFCLDSFGSCPRVCLVHKVFQLFDPLLCSSNIDDEREDVKGSFFYRSTTKNLG